MKLFRTVANVVTDAGVLAQGGNTALNWHGGAPAILFNLAALGVCAGLRARAEFTNNSVISENASRTLLQRMLDSPQTSLAAAGAAQLMACGALVAHIDVGAIKSVSDAAKAFYEPTIPFLFAVGDAAVVLDVMNAQSKLPRITLNPFNFFTAGLLLAGSARMPALFFGSAALLSTYQSIRNSKAGTDPCYLMAAGNVGAAAINWSDPVLAPVLNGFWCSFFKHEGCT